MFYPLFTLWLRLYVPANSCVKSEAWPFSGFSPGPALEDFLFFFQRFFSWNRVNYYVYPRFENVKNNQAIKVFLYDNLLIILSLLNLCSRLWGTLIIGIWWMYKANQDAGLPSQQLYFWQQQQLCTVHCTIEQNVCNIFQIRLLHSKLQKVFIWPIKCFPRRYLIMSSKQEQFNCDWKTGKKKFTWKKDNPHNFYGFTLITFM